MSDLSQMHVHVVGRFRADPAWPGPVWCHGTGPTHEPEALARLVGRYAAAAGKMTPG